MDSGPRSSAAGRLEGAVVVATRTATGSGQAAALRLAEYGATVVPSDFMAAELTAGKIGKLKVEGKLGVALKISAMLSDKQGCAGGTR
jgi:NAD(P)-dependent dehydrogenase (short-subunit alcohol dehydrogenase family)